MHNFPLERRSKLVANSDIRQVSERGLPSAVSTGVDFEQLAVGAILEIETGHTTYRVENRGKGKALISGHPSYCPVPVEVEIQGSVGGPGLVKIRWIEPGLKMVFEHPEFGVIRTSTIRSIRQLLSAPAFSLS